MIRWRRIILSVLLLVIVLCLMPLGAYLWSEWAAARWGCEFGRAMGRDGCWVGGVDRAPALIRAYSSVALLVLTLPVAFLSSLIALIILARRPSNERRKEK
ncbi:hypothetical protein shim_19240 [Shimia sp. SK013]|uniref:hypothetical protein n=1 Tax=Shimia sp. SK013 TaxID=1389006 RepID=UPI0006B5DFFD|nr:hypothetical protein [Shimia sp. SK013]KPA22037.1 hypothetical protein shim_19240 [Shimia sp. SK013]